jgi:membrane protein DedA with SNARE-associated domain
MDSLLFSLIDTLGLPGVFLLMVLETVFPPIPSEIIMPLAGVRAADGAFPLWALVLVGSGGAMLGNLGWFLMARAIGLPRFRLFLRRYGRWLTLDWPSVRVGQRFFAHHGAWFVFGGRLVPTLRSLVSIPAGLLQMPLLPFLFWSSLGTVLWTSGLAIAGYVLGSQFHAIDQLLGPLSTFVIVAVIALYGWRQATWTRRHPR